MTLNLKQLSNEDLAKVVSGNVELAAADIDVLLMNRSRLKAYGNPDDVRDRAKVRVILNAVRLAMAEYVLGNPGKLYAADLAKDYKKKLKEIGIEIRPAEEASGS